MMRTMTMIALAGTVAGALPPPARAQQMPEGVKAGVQREATQPLRDVRIEKDKIPEILLLAASAPYSSEHTKSCGAILAEIDSLNAALGADVDGPAKEKGEGAAIAAAGARALVNTLIPGLGIVRVITGADKAQRRAEAAVYAGSVRRGYLKGIGLSKGCKPPAAPLAEAVADRQELPPVKDDDKKDDK